MAKNLMGIKGRLSVWLDRLQRNIGSKESTANFNLTPKRDADQTGLYLDLLNEKILDPETKNVALTGRYGSGKSSILRTLELEHPEFKYLNISLAAFNVGDTPPDLESLPVQSIEKKPNTQNAKKSTSAQELQIEAIEYSILQQIFYHVDHRRIPYSRFKRIKNLPSYILFVRSLFFVTWCISVAYLILHDEIFSIKTDWARYIQWPEGILKSFPLLFAIFGAIFILYLVFRVYNNSKFHKLNLTSGEVEISPENELSILNRHMDELIYFFEATRFNVVILEDLDRFDDPEIFTHLRELNAIINNSEQVGRKITFLYALRDDVFRNEKRTKFFDFIIPVIPVVDTKNSAEQISSRLTEIGLTPGLIPETFIADIAQYVQDMRLIINTINEFKLYKTRLNSSNEGCLPLLAMMFFKNMYPKQFARLQDGKGLAFKVLNSKKAFISKLSIKYDDQIKMLSDEINKLEDIYFKNIAELRSVYVCEILKKLPPSQRTIRINNSNIDLGILAANDDFELMVIEGTLRSERSNGSVGTLGTFSEIEKAVDGDQGYSKRLKDLKERVENKTGKLLRQRSEAQAASDAIRKLSLQEILSQSSMVELSPELSGNALLTFLVASGYITEDYHYYLSYFLPGSLSLPDMEFFFAVKEGRFLGYDHKLDKLETLLNRLALRDFSSVNVLNNSLINHLLSSKSREQELKSVLAILANDSDKSLAFIEQYFRLGGSRELFTKELGRYWKRMYVWSKNDAKLPPEKQLEYLGWILKYCRLEDLPSLDVNGSLSEFLGEMPDFVSWIRAVVDDEHAIKIISKLEVAFDRLTDLEQGDIIVEYIYVHNHYFLNPHMISALTIFQNKDVDREDLKRSLLTTVRLNGLDEMLGYIEEYMNEYIIHVFKELPDNKFEDEDTILFMLDPAVVTDDLRLEVLNQSEIKFSDIQKVNDSLWELVIKNSKVAPTWLNVYHIYKKSDSFDKTLLGFLNTEYNYRQLADHELAAELVPDKIAVTKFAQELMLQNEISEVALDSLLKGYKIYFDNVPLEGYERSRVEIMLQHNRFYFREELFEQLQNNFSGLQKIYVEFNWDDFLTEIDSLVLMAADYELLLSSNDLENEQLAILAGRITPDLLNDSRALSLTFAKVINEQGILAAISYSIMDVVFRQIDSVDLKIDLLNTYFYQYNENEISNLLILMGGKWKEIISYKNPRFDNSDSILSLLKRLKQAKIYVTKVDSKGAKIHVYTKTKPKS
ncbi:MAG TPA: hypothetical protein VK541_05350 [Pedobacter sp.]|uniref:YobI family P-loop NTPase n=1 Tax=Pedobacter sp. TaxID=1411316 RepID=UPI002CCE3970|nr:hypothetical protein [Pedobacter sp.]HMI01885.1 hypothetical protein [Pedobacter sp.]